MVAVKIFSHILRHRSFKMMVPIVLLQIQLAILCFWSWRGVEGKVGKGQRRMFIKTNNGPHRGVWQGSLRLTPALQSLHATTSVRQICLQQTPTVRLSTKCNETCIMFHTWGRIKVNSYTDWQRMVVKRCTTRTVCWIKLHRNSSSRLKKYHGFFFLGGGGARAPCAPPMDPPVVIVNMTRTPHFLPTDIA